MDGFLLYCCNYRAVCAEQLARCNLPASQSYVAGWLYPALAVNFGGLLRRDTLRGSLLITVLTVLLKTHAGHSGWSHTGAQGGPRRTTALYRTVIRGRGIAEPQSRRRASDSHPTRATLDRVRRLSMPTVPMRLSRWPVTLGPFRRPRKAYYVRPFARCGGDDGLRKTEYVPSLRCTSTQRPLYRCAAG